MFWGQHKIIPQHSRDKLNLPPNLFTCPIQNGDSSALVLTSSHPIGVAAHSEIHTLWALHDVFWPTTPIHGLRDCTNPTSSVTKRVKQKLDPWQVRREDPFNSTQKLCELIYYIARRLLLACFVNMKFDWKKKSQKVMSIEGQFLIWAGRGSRVWVHTAYDKRHSNTMIWENAA